MVLSFVFVLLLVTQAICQFEGQRCVKDGKTGFCANIRNCQAAIADLRAGKRPQICTFQDSDPIVCCLDNVGATTASIPVATTSTTKKPTETTTEYIPPVYDYHVNVAVSGACENIPSSLTSPKTGQKAFDKCVEYQEQLVYPCERGVALSGELARANHCHHNADELIVGGVDAAQNEFPHMALIGYGDEPNIQWLCGGALISDRFVLTAGHCISSRDAGPITHVAVGVYRRSDSNEPGKRYKVKNIIKHPQYLPPVKYNDIALLETETPMTLSEFVVPACLDVGGDGNSSRALASGWGLTEYKGQTAEILQKVTLNKFTTAECEQKYPLNRHMRQGVVGTQMCYGDKDVSKDTCQGDSGGPLQIKSKKINCMYLIVGVTSFGRACGFVGEPGIYTKVSEYIPWIEGIVWPDS